MRGRLRSLVLLIALVSLFASAQSHVAAEEIVPDLHVTTEQFMGLQLGFTFRQVQAAGVKALVPRTSDMYGPYYEAAKLPREPNNVVKRKLYFSDGYGLYGISTEIAGPNGRGLKAREMYDIIRALVERFRSENAGSNTKRLFAPSAGGMSLNQLRDCPNGKPRIREKLNALDLDETRELFNKLQENKSFAGIVLAMHCGARDGIEILIGLSPDREVGVYSLTNDIDNLRVAIVYGDPNIINLMRK